jgi:hypothetical protein
MSASNMATYSAFTQISTSLISESSPSPSMLNLKKAAGIARIENWFRAEEGGWCLFLVLLKRGEVLDLGRGVKVSDRHVGGFEVDDRFSRCRRHCVSAFERDCQVLRRCRASVAQASQSQHKNVGRSYPETS